MSAYRKVHEFDGPDAPRRWAALRGHRLATTTRDGVVGESMAAQLRTAFNAQDMDALRSLIAEDATWGEDHNGAACCRNRDEIMSRLKLLLAAGVQATIMETRIGPRGIAARVEVRWPRAQDARADRISYAQVYVVRDGLVSEIHGHDDMDSALAAVVPFTTR